MKVITWNVNQVMSFERAERVATWLVDQDAAVILLQEVVCGRDEVLESRLGDTHDWFYARVRGDRSLYGSAIAVAKRFGARRVEPLARSEAQEERRSAPEMVIGVEAPALGVVISAHFPNGSGWGWGKINVWRELQAWIDGRTGPMILGGDFNAPGLEVDGKAYCFGTQLQIGGHFRDLSPSTARMFLDSGELAPVTRLWERWKDSEGREGSGAEWEEVESWIFNRSAEHGLVDAVMSAPDVGDVASLYSHYVRGIKTRYDHIFARGWRSTSASYFPKTLRRGDPDGPASDHAALVVEFEGPTSQAVLTQPSITEPPPIRGE
ncbi:MAG: endonuclease/exonuclease/phosphatase family protein [Myxococcales bacterium]|nr:endonuclease/exonuclease/phosphatase family protein [Myxococcales bacterium]